MGRLTWAGAHRLSLRWCLCLASSAGSLSPFSVGTILKSGSLVPWQRTDNLNLPQRSQMDRSPHTQPTSSLRGLNSQQPQAPVSKAAAKALQVARATTVRSSRNFCVWTIVEASKGPAPWLTCGSSEEDWGPPSNQTARSMTNHWRRPGCKKPGTPLP